MNTIAIIEDDPQDFELVKNIFDDTSKNIWPDYNEFWKKVWPKGADSQSGGFENDLVSNICNQIECNLTDISAIIMDISLYNDTDDLGIKIIKQIRNKKELKYKLIPIFCYSRHGNSIGIRKEALASGATNIFNKEVVDNQGIDAKKDIAELKITVDYHMLAYQLAQYSITSLERVEDRMEENAKKTDFLVEGLISLMKLDKINEITDDTEKEQMLESIFGGKDKLAEVKRELYREEKNNKLSDDLDDIADLLPQGLNIIPKLLSMFLKNID